MDLKTTAEKLPLDNPDEIKGKSLYKIVFKDNKHTILSYEIINRFELIKLLINDCKPYKIDNKDNKDDEYPIVNISYIDIVCFMSMLNKMLYYSKYNQDLLDRLDYNERNVYDYLITDKDYNDDIIKIKKELLDIISASIQVYLLKYNGKNNNNCTEYIISTGDIIFKKLCNKYNDLGSINVLKQSDEEYELYINIYCVSCSYTTIFSEKEYDILIYDGFFKPLNYTVNINTNYFILNNDKYIVVEMSRK
jgi:hypothetical protein